jgi:hypothetical protein
VSSMKIKHGRSSGSPVFSLTPTEVLNRGAKTPKPIGKALTSWTWWIPSWTVTRKLFIWWWGRVFFVETITTTVSASSTTRCAVFSPGSISISLLFSSGLFPPYYFVSLSSFSYMARFDDRYSLSPRVGIVDVAITSNHCLFLFGAYFLD